MTDAGLSRVLRGTKIKHGQVVHKVDNIEAVQVFLKNREKCLTLENKYIRVYSGVNEFIFVLVDGIKVGIIMKCGRRDVHIYMYKNFRNKGYMSRITGNHFLATFWPDIESVTCANEVSRHIMANAGFKIRN